MLYENAAFFENYFDREVIFTKELDDFLKENNIKYTYEWLITFPNDRLIFSHENKRMAIDPAILINTLPLTKLIDEIKTLLEV